MNTDRFNELLGDHEIFHSKFQMDYFITTRAGGTAYGMYKQSLRELSRRFSGLAELYVDRELAKIKVEEDEACQTSGTAKRKHEILLAQKRYSLGSLDKVIADTEREFLRFYGQADALKKQIGELTPERRDELDAEMWEHSVKVSAACDLMSGRSIGRNTVEQIMSLPPEMRARVLLLIQNSKAIIEWFLAYKQPKMEIPTGLPDVSPRELVAEVFGGPLLECRNAVATAATV